MALQSRFKGVIAVLMLLVFAALGGCAGSPAPPATSAPGTLTSPLAGNWLLLGTLADFAPTPILFPPQPQTKKTALAVSLDVSGSTITASAALVAQASTCGVTVDLGPIAVATGTIAPDGSFTVTAPTLSSLAGALPVLTLTGNAPQSVGAPWTGTYTISVVTPSLNGSVPCSITQTGSFTAASLADVTGAYTGTGSFPTFLPTTPQTPVSMSINLQQGADLYGPRVTAPAYSKLALGGSVQLTGIPCFSKGAISTEFPSVVEGSRFLANFTAEDGTKAQINGLIDDSAAARLSILTIAVQGPQCNNVYDFFGSPLLVQR